MEPWIIVSAVTLAYLAASLVVGTLPGRKATGTAEGYVAGDRTLGLVLMYFITGATIFSAFAFLGGPGWAYSRGAAAFYILGYGALGFVPFYFLGPRAARVGRAYGFVTQAEMVAERFKRRSIAGVMAIISVVAFVPYLALQIEGAGIVLSAVTHGRIPEWAGGALVYGVVLAYVLRSGVLGVGWTNAFQGVFMMLLAWGLGLYLPFKLYGGVGEMFSQIAAERPEMLLAPGLKGGAPWSWGEYSSAVLVSAIGFSVWPHLFMKAFTARDDDTIRRTVVLYPTFQIFLVPLFLIGFCGVFFTPQPDAANEVLPHMLMHMDIPALLVGLFCAGALAASMSSGDAMVHAAASIAVRDGVVKAFGGRFNPGAERTAIRWVVVLVMLVSYLVAVLYEGSLVNLLLFAYGPVVQFAPGVIAALVWRRANGWAVLVGLVCGGVVNLVLVIWPDLRPFAIHAGMYGLTINAMIVVVGSLLAPRGNQDDRFVRIADGEAPGA
ncbi:MAG: sodium:solute symporter family protein [Acidobacteriota bacterium]|nr:sodium:solute symporter family protein [Acidobacteriota bacterium]